MAVAGVILEANPLHEGHKYLLKAIRSEGFSVVAAMSGSFVQRGEPAVFSKKARTKALLQSGADLVLELPVRGVLSGAQGFARSGVGLFEAAGVVDCLFFGSECGKIDSLWQASELLHSQACEEAIRGFMQEGNSYPAACERALSRVGGDGALLRTPNNILGVEYLSELRRLGSSMQARTVARIPARSASDWRKALQSGEEEALRIYSCEPTQGPVFPEDLARAILARLRRMTAEDFQGLPDVNEGLENRIAAAISQAASLEEAIEAIQTRRYPLARIRRILLRAYLGIREPAGAPEAIRILGLRKEAAPLCRLLREKSLLPVAQNPAVDADLPEIREQIAAQDIWAAFSPQPLPPGVDYREFPVVL